MLQSLISARWASLQLRAKHNTDVEATDAHVRHIGPQVC